MCNLPKYKTTHTVRDKERPCLSVTTMTKFTMLHPPSPFLRVSAPRACSQYPGGGIPSDRIGFSACRVSSHALRTCSVIVGCACHGMAFHQTLCTSTLHPGLFSLRPRPNANPEALSLLSLHDWPLASTLLSPSPPLLLCTLVEHGPSPVPRVA